MCLYIFIDIYIFLFLVKVSCELLLKKQHVPKTQYLSYSGSQWVSSKITDPADVSCSSYQEFSTSEIFQGSVIAKIRQEWGERTVARIVGIRLNSGSCQSQVKQLHLESVVREDIVYSAGRRSSAGRANRLWRVLWEAFSGARCRH